jgi:hypothetical protein
MVVSWLVGWRLQQYVCFVLIFLSFLHAIDEMGLGKTGKCHDDVCVVLLLRTYYGVD